MLRHVATSVKSSTDVCLRCSILSGCNRTVVHMSILSCSSALVSSLIAVSQHKERHNNSASKLCREEWAASRLWPSRLRLPVSHLSSR